MSFTLKRADERCAFRSVRFFLIYNMYISIAFPTVPTCVFLGVRLLLCGVEAVYENGN